MTEHGAVPEPSALDDELIICAMERALRLVDNLMDPKARELAYCAACIIKPYRRRFDLDALHRAAIYRARIHPKEGTSS